MCIINFVILSPPPRFSADPDSKQPSLVVCSQQSDEQQPSQPAVINCSKAATKDSALLNSTASAVVVDIQSSVLKTTAVEFQPSAVTAAAAAAAAATKTPCSNETLTTTDTNSSEDICQNTVGGKTESIDISTGTLAAVEAENSSSTMKNRIVNETEFVDDATTQLDKSASAVPLAPVAAAVTSVTDIDNNEISCGGKIATNDNTTANTKTITSDETNAVLDSNLNVCEKIEKIDGSNSSKTESIDTKSVSKMNNNVNDLKKVMLTKSATSTTTTTTIEPVVLSSNNNNNNVEKVVTSDFEAMKRIPTAKSVAEANAAAAVASAQKAAAAAIAAAAAAAVSEVSASDQDTSAPAVPFRSGASRSQTLLKYEDDQWSPQNAAGRKFYKRDQLYSLRDVPASMHQPECIDNLGAIAKQTNLLPKFIQTQQPAVNSQQYKQTISSGGGGGQSGSRSSFNKRPSQNSSGLPQGQSGQSQVSGGGGSNGGGKSGSKSGMIHLSLSLREEVKLNVTKNAWKPGFFQSRPSGEDNTTESLYKRVRGVLNKLTPEKFDTLLDQMTKFDIDSVEKLNGVIVLVFEKAIDEPNFSVEYAKLCQKLSAKWLEDESHRVKAAAAAAATNNISEESKKHAEEQASLDAAEKTGQHALFKKELITKCQTEFKNNVARNEAISDKLTPFQQRVAEATDPDARTDAMAMLEEEERRLRRRSVGTVKFIGELYKNEMLTTKIMMWCVGTLLVEQTEDKLECLCKLLTTVGQRIEAKTSEPTLDRKNTKTLGDYFKTMQMLVEKKSKVSSRVRFMLQDVIELRRNKWIPRRNDSNPKTMGQIQKEAEAEQNNIHMLNYVMPGSGGGGGGNGPHGRKDDRGGVRDGGRMTGGGGYNKNNSRGGSGSGGGGGHGPDDGWSSVVKQRSNISIDPSKLRSKPVSCYFIFIVPMLLLNCMFRFC